MAKSDRRSYIGVMSGTSLDAIDAVLLHFDATGGNEVGGGVSIRMPDSLKRELLALNQPGAEELDRAARASLELGRLYANVVTRLLESTGLRPADIEAIGVHGQTVRHRPDLGYTIQLNAPALVAELTGIDIIADFRSRDIAAGGQGAPLVPAFHAARFASEKTRVVLNLGGIANITVLSPSGDIRGFDTGPGNMLLDEWVQQHRDQPYDEDGEWAKSGQPIPKLLACLMADPWFKLPPPKSTGRDDFNLAWLEDRLLATFGAEADRSVPPQDVQATLLQLTAQSVAAAVKCYAADAHDVLVCGGGAQNTALLNALAAALPCRVETTAAHGLPTQWVEAAAFAWLAWCHDEHRPAGLPAVTGARTATVLGCRYPA